MIGSIMRYHPLNVLGLVKAAPVEGDRKSLQASMVGGGCVVQDGGGIDAPAEPDTQGNIGEKVLANGLLQKKIQLFLRALEVTKMRRGGGQAPIGFGANLAVLPLIPEAGWEL